MKTPYQDPPQSIAASPFNRIRRTVTEIEGKLEAAVRALEKISMASDLRISRQIASETLAIIERDKT